jgi:type IV secretory pathway TraG/TraD family ATPase VirD4
MSRTTYNQPWGPSHQQLQPAPSGARSIIWKIIGSFVLAVFAHGIIDPHGPNIIGWSIKMTILGWIAIIFIKGIRNGTIDLRPLVRLIHDLTGPERSVDQGQREPATTNPRDAGEQIRARVLAQGGGAYLGLDDNGDWVTADPESAVMVLGPPRSGKTSAVIIPALLGASGPAISTSTKPDVMNATVGARAELGQVWLFDPAGQQTETPDGVRRLCWSPVAAAESWDQALITARAMTACTRVGSGTTNEQHWTERAAALLAPLLYAAHLTERPMEDVLRWILRQDLTEPLQTLCDSDSDIAVHVLIGIKRTDSRERSSIFSATAGVLAAYNADATRATAANPNFDPTRFAASTDTIYITAAEHHQALCAPLIVGLLEQIRHAVYHTATHTTGPRMLWALDEVANIAPIHDLPALVSQAGGQNLQVMVGLQDFSQARTRWGHDAADGFMSLFQTRLVLSGIADSATLESISLALGEYDRELISTSNGTSQSGEWLTPPGRSENTTYQTQRQRTLIPGEVAQLPDGHGLLLRGGSWGLIELTLWHRRGPWCELAGSGWRRELTLGSD